MILNLRKFCILIVEGLMFISRGENDSMLVIKTVVAAWKMLLIIILSCLISGVIMWAVVSLSLCIRVRHNVYYRYHIAMYHVCTMYIPCMY